MLVSPRAACQRPPSPPSPALPWHPHIPLAPALPWQVQSRWKSRHHAQCSLSAHAERASRRLSDCHTNPALSLREGVPSTHLSTRTPDNRSTENPSALVPLPPPPLIPPPPHVPFHAQGSGAGLWLPALRRPCHSAPALGVLPRPDPSVSSGQNRLFPRRPRLPSSHAAMSGSPTGPGGKGVS